MLTLFRKIRKSLLEASPAIALAKERGSARRYTLYAIGEIALVVIGILIALQINNWNEDQKYKIDEKRYVNDLIQDLKNDSISLEEINRFLEAKAASKLKIEPILRGKLNEIDSMEYHFTQQWAVNNRCTPTDITFEELKYSGNLNIIRDVSLRREIVSIYNLYSNEKSGEDRFILQNTKLVDLASSYFNNVLEPNPDEIKKALKDNSFINAIITNFTFARKDAITQLQKSCSELIVHLSQYKKLIDP